MCSGVQSEESVTARTFPATVRYRKGKEGKSAFITIPLAVRNAYALLEGSTMWLQVIAVDPPKQGEKKK